MKKHITIGAHIGSLFIFLLVIDAPMSVLRFIMVGELPGGNFTLPAEMMLLIIGILVIASIAYGLLQILPQSKIPPVVSRHMPKRRYTAIQ